MTEEHPSALAAMRALRDEIRARLDQNEDYRAWKALDAALRELEPPRLPTAHDFALPAASDFAVETSLADLNFAQTREGVSGHSGQAHAPGGFLNQFRGTGGRR